MYEVDVMTVEQLKFWILCLEQAIDEYDVDEYDVDVVFDRANELYSNGDMSMVEFTKEKLKLLNSLTQRLKKNFASTLPSTQLLTLK